MDLCAPETFQDLISRLREIFKSDRVDIDYVKALMSSCKGKITELEKFAKFEVDRYTRNLVDAGNGKYNLILVCWDRSSVSPIHSHSNSHCFMTILDGLLTETIYDWPKDSDPEAEMTCLSETSFNVGDTAYINDDIGLHRIGNYSPSDKAMSLHLYSPPFDECKVFQQQTGHCSTAKVTFWSKYGQLTPQVGRA